MLTNAASEGEGRRAPLVGMIGGGQLARMTASAAARLGVSIVVLDPDAGCPAAPVAHVVVGDPLDRSALLAFGRQVDVVTFDHERVPIELIEALLADGVSVAPSAAVAHLASDKGVGLTQLSALGFPVPEFSVVSDVADIEAFGDHHGWPVVVKATRGGYDGRGVMFIERDRAGKALEVLGPELVVEQRIDFDGELAVVVARRASGEIAAFPAVSTVQRDEMCAEVTCPASVPPAVAAAAEELAVALAGSVGLVGVMAVELFVVGDRLLVNELATRPHNTGHLTIEGCVTSQFEQHLRAILDLPLGSTALRGRAAAMFNVVGDSEASDPTDRLAEALAVTGAHVHLYGKRPRPGRKLGHVTAVAESVAAAREIAGAAADRLNGHAADRLDSSAADLGECA